MLSDVEFEELAGDLIGATMGVPVERFAAGADGGIDLRWGLAEGTAIGQCKHYARSTFSQLFSAAEREVAKMEKINPDTYKFITTFDLAVSQKDKLFSLFRRWMSGPQDVIGARDIDALITLFPQVEQRHPKLWVSSGLQLFWATHSEIANRAAALTHRISTAMPRYVVNSGYERAREILAESNVCLVSGPPGIGKTSLAHMLLAEHVALGFEPVEVSADVEEAWATLSKSSPQIFLYDDFLGQITFSERLGKNEDRRLRNFIERIAGSPDKKLVLTTREYILKDAKRTYESLAEFDAKFHFVLELSDYSRGDRARILYNHLWHSNVSRTCLAEVARGGYKAVIDHTVYSPRVIEYCTGSGFDITSPGYPKRFVEALDNPERVWRVAFERHLTPEQQILVAVLCTLPIWVRVNYLEEAHISACSSLGISATGRTFLDALAPLEGTFVSIERDTAGIPEISLANPSVREFALNILANDKQLFAKVLNSAQFFEQFSRTLSYGWGKYSSKKESARRIRDAVVSHGPLFIEGLERTLSTAPIEKRETWPPQGMDEPDSLEIVAERRAAVLFQAVRSGLTGQAAVRRAVESIIQRWSAGEGDKEAANELFTLIRSSDYCEYLASDAHNALHLWLETTLETTKDWHVFMNHLSEGCVWEAKSFGLSSAFEIFANDEFIYCSPWPPDMDELHEIAEYFNLPELVERITDAIEQEKDETSRVMPKPVEVVVEADPRGSDSYIAELFGRLEREAES